MKSNILQNPATLRWAAAAGLAALTFATFLVVNAIHFRMFEVSVVLYAAMSDAVLATALVGAALLAAARLRGLPFGLSELETALAWACGALASLTFAVLIPAVVDRSLSVYLLEKLDQRGGSIAADKLETIFTTEYLQEQKVVGVRLTEQSASGTIVVIDNCVRLTPKGERAVAFAQGYRRAMLPRKRRIQDEVTDSLTNPVSGDAAGLPRYGCAEGSSQ